MSGAVQIATLAPVTIASGGTAQRLSANEILVTGVTIQAGFSNVGRLAIGDSTVTNSTGIEVPSGDTCNLDGPIGRNGVQEFSLSDIWVVSATTGDSCRVSYFKRRL